MRITHGIETLVGAPAIWLIADEIPYEHVVSNHSIQSKNAEWLFVTI